MRSRYLKDTSYPKSSGEADKSRFCCRINWYADVRVNTNVAASIDDDTTLTTPISAHKSLSKQSTAYYSIL